MIEYKMELNDELKSILEGKEGETKQNFWNPTFKTFI